MPCTGPMEAGNGGACKSYGEFIAEHEGTAHWQSGNFDTPAHFVDIVRSSRLGSMFQEGHLATNSMHHQGVCKVAPRLDAVAYGPDGLVEAVEVRDRTFMLGVQWHPEFFAGPNKMGCIFSTLVSQAAKAHARRPSHLQITRTETDDVWPDIEFADYI